GPAPNRDPEVRRAPLRGRRPRATAEAAPTPTGDCGSPRVGVRARGLSQQLYMPRTTPTRSGSSDVTADSSRGQLRPQHRRLLQGSRRAQSDLGLVTDAIEPAP